MRDVRVESWNDLNDRLFEGSWQGELGRFRATCAYRGVARVGHDLRTSLTRLGARARELEGHILRNFRKYARRESMGDDSAWNWLALAQHHGLPTRLLDWTFSPWVAAHFATATATGSEAIVWAVDCAAAHDRLPGMLRDTLRAEGATVFTTELLADHAPTLGALDRLGADEPFALFFEPPSLDDRIVNQSAVLSIISAARVHMDDWLDEHPDVWHAWRITPQAKAEIRERLDQGNITERVLMPGLDGLATWLRRYYAPGHTDRAAMDGGGAMSAPPSRAGTGQGEPR
jgi:FRG domain